MANTLNKKEVVASRLRAVRERLGLTQREIAERSQIPLPSYKDYEVGNRMPGGEALGLLVASGINGNWLLTGRGAMLLGEEGPQREPDPEKNSFEGKIDPKRLGYLCRLIDEICMERSIGISAEKRGYLLALLYECTNDVENIDPSIVENFVSLAS